MADGAVDVAIDVGPDRIAIDRALELFCDRYLGGLQSRVADAIRYSLMGEGKRLRGILFLRAYDAAGGTSDGSAMAGAIEVVHAYSLVHDDLPCMDDDDMRRGRPTVHRAFGVAAATAAGLAMVPLAARCASDAAHELELDDDEAGTIVRALMIASGAGGMIGGQLLDLEGEGRPLALEELQRIHNAKTGALIAAAAAIGGRAARTSPPRRAAHERYGADIGQASQIADDVLDVTATTDQLGKTAGRDVALQKSTYPALLGIDGAKARADALVREGCAALDEVGLLTPSLDRLAHFTVERTS
jgi:geranylgeranyl pyrophosphate synthase